MQLQVVFNHNLTPLSEKDIYHIQLSSQTPLDYQEGDWLKVFPQNLPGLVKIVLKKLNLSGSETLELRRLGSMTVLDALTHHLEITQLNPAILNKIQRQFDLNLWPNRQAMMDDAKGKDIVDLLERFAFLPRLGLDFLALLSPLAPRYYSISSAPIDEYKMDLLYLEVVSQCQERTRFGVASHELAQLQPGDFLKVEISHNATFKLPEHLTTPIIMVGAGTGLAPYRGFCQARFASDEPSENWLFFGEIHRASSFLWQDELEAWQAQRGLNLLCAFSRDQAEKLYVTDLLWQHKKPLWETLQKGAHFYICGSKVGLARGVEQVMLRILQTEGGLSEEQAQAQWRSWKTQRRVQQDVY